MKRRNLLRAMGAGPLAAAAHPGKELLFGRPPRSIAAETRGSQRTAGHVDPWIEVELSAIAYNFAKLRELVKVPIMAAVKANAYGHGLVKVSRALEKAGADWLMVEKLEEAATLRDSGITCPGVRHAASSAGIRRIALAVWNSGETNFDSGLNCLFSELRSVSPEFRGVPQSPQNCLVSGLSGRHFGHLTDTSNPWYQSWLKVIKERRQSQPDALNSLPRRTPPPNPLVVT